MAGETPKPLPEWLSAYLLDLPIRDNGRLIDTSVWGISRVLSAAIADGVVPQGFRIHDLRHSAATYWAHRETPAMFIQWMLGHADLKTTQRYISDDPELLRSLAEHGPIDTKRTQLSLPAPDVFSDADRRSRLLAPVSEREAPEK